MTVARSVALAIGGTTMEWWNEERQNILAIMERQFDPHKVSLIHALAADSAEFVGLEN